MVLLISRKKIWRPGLESLGILLLRNAQGLGAIPEAERIRGVRFQQRDGNLVVIAQIIRIDFQRLLIIFAGIGVVFLLQGSKGGSAGANAGHLILHLLVIGGAYAIRVFPAGQRLEAALSVGTGFLSASRVLDLAALKKHYNGQGTHIVRVNRKNLPG